MRDKPTVSLYMPSHNREDLLPRAIASVMAQTYPVYELIVVDDGSSDGTWDLLTKLQKQHDNLVILRHETPKGACAARNSAINMAKGEFISGLDDDDELLPNHLESLLEHWDDKYSCVASSLLNDNGSVRVRQGKEYGEINLNQLLHYNRLGNQILTRTERLRDIGGFDESLPAFQDYDCWVRMIEHYGQAYKLQHPTYVLHTAHELNRISGNPARRLKALELFVAKHKQKFSPAHFKSALLMEKRIKQEAFGFWDALSMINKDNYRAVISAYLTASRSTN